MKPQLFKSMVWLSLFTMISISLFCQTSEDYLKMANTAFDAGDKDKAKDLYLKAAKMNNAEAHFAIAYKFVVTDEERIFHFTEAAKMGHAKALEYALDELVFRADNFNNANPELALEIYQTAKARNPTLAIFDEEGKIHTIRKCVEAGPFDAKQFIAKYRITQQEMDEDYGIWQLAEEASKGGRFGTPDPKLVFQLVCRGGDVPREFEGAVADTYDRWKENKIDTFNICDYAGSGFGLGFCVGREEEDANRENLVRIKGLAPRLRNGAGAMLDSVFHAAAAFIEKKAWREEGSDGSGYVAWAKESIISQKKEYLDLVERINNQIGLDSIIEVKDADKRLNDTYQKVESQLKKKPIDNINLPITAPGVRSVERLWINYRDNTSKLFATLAPTISEEVWKSWLTEIRIKQLKAIIEPDE